MSYIGNSPISVAFLTDTFSGDGTTTAFTMSIAPATTSSVLVSITGVLQSPDTYSVSGTTLTFSAAPPSGTNNISARYLGIPASGVTTTAYRTVTDFTATAAQTSFSVPSYTVGYIDVYRNGVRLVSTDFTATTGTTVVLANACTSGDSVVTESFYVSSVLNAIPATAGSVSDSYIVSMAGSKLTGTQVIPKATLPTGSVLQVVPGTTSTTVSNSTSTYADTGLTATITPSSSSSKIIVLITHAECAIATTSANRMRFQLLKNATVISPLALQIGFNATASNIFGCAFSYVDSPASTSALIYKTQFANDAGAFASVSVQNNSMPSTIILMEIAA